LRRKRTTLLISVAILAATLVSIAKNTKLTGKIVGYDVMHHTSKSASVVQNEEVVVLQTTNPKEKYVKVMFSSFGTTQIESKYFDGTEPLTVDVIRDHSCDERIPTFVSQVTLEQIARTYLLTDAFKSQHPGRIKTLKCYVAVYKKKKK
jgi:hypothetical protein